MGQPQEQSRMNYVADSLPQPCLWPNINIPASTT
jgi:hypothetical protein